MPNPKPPRKRRSCEAANPSTSEEEGHWSCTEGRASSENPERLAAVNAIDVHYGKAGL